MKIRNALAITAAALALCAPAGAMSKKPKVTVRFHAEANTRDSGTFAMPARLVYAQRDAVINRVPEFSERQIAAIFPFKTADGTWGCVFKLDEQGRIRLETMSNQQRGAAIVVFIGTKTGQHQVMDMVIDRPVTTGIITVQRGLTDLEVEFLRKDFHVLGTVKKEKPAKEKKQEIPGAIDRERDARENLARQKSGKPPAAEATVPRLPD